MVSGVFLHVLADTLGSVFVIISTLLIQWFGWTWVDPLCSLILSVLILGSVYPLLTSSVNTLLQNIPDDEEFEHHLCEALEVEGVKSYSKAHYWQLKSDLNVASVHIQATPEANAQLIRHKVAAQLRAAGATQCSVQVEKDFFTQRIQQLCPSYRFGHTVARGTTIARERKPQNNHGHSHNGHGHGHSH
ncbi:Solute carrier family 30 (Zinc transporter) member 5 [Trichostrongylus colubriformis]|uniref:Proton-coupled zinc antiporter SLC30A5 n=1 Tax=Trichostrongylus colubriformis TaxID=6319 RepID=A0AAN8FVN2_TRICO